MNIKKTDVFSGIGVFVIQMIANAICFAFEKNKIYLGVGIIFAILVSISVVIIISLNRKLKNQSIDFNNQIELLTKEKDELNKIAQQTKELNSDLEHERDDIAQEIENIEQELKLYNNQCAYYDNTRTINRKILYSLKQKKKCDIGELQSIISDIEFIFRDDVFSKNAKINTSVFYKSTSDTYTILISTKHSPGTIEKLKLDNKSVVGAAFNEKKVIYCGDIDNRKADFPFIELDGSRQYQSILAVPLIIDDTTEFVMVITCTNTNCLEETYNKYREVIQRYLELLGVLLFISSSKEESK